MAQMFDEKELLERVDNDLSFLSDTVHMLETDGRSLMDEIRLAVQAGDAAAIGRTAHTLKGMVSNFCSPAVQAMALAAEQAGKAGDCAAVIVIAGALESSLEMLIDELGAFVKARSGCAS